MSVKELKPCPFCGWGASIEKFYPYDGYRGESPMYKIRCRGCGVVMQNYSEGEVVESWNERVEAKNE